MVEYIYLYIEAIAMTDRRNKPCIIGRMTICERRLIAQRPHIIVREISQTETNMKLETPVSLSSCYWVIDITDGARFDDH